MSITLIKNANLSDMKKALSELLGKGIRSDDVRQLAIEITRGNDSIASIHDWVKANVKYVPDPEDTEWFTSPVKMVEKYRTGEEMQEDCDGASLMTAALAGSIGLSSRIALFAYKRYEFEHAVGEIYSDSLQDWILVDTTSSYPVGWFVPYVRKDVVYAS